MEGGFDLVFLPEEVGLSHNENVELRKREEEGLANLLRHFRESSSEDISRRYSTEEIDSFFKSLLGHSEGNEVIGELTRRANILTKNQQIGLLKAFSAPSMNTMIDLSASVPDGILRQISVDEGIIRREDRNTSRGTLIERLQRKNPNYFSMRIKKEFNSTNEGREEFHDLPEDRYVPHGETLQEREDNLIIAILDLNREGPDEPMKGKLVEVQDLIPEVTINEIKTMFEMEDSNKKYLLEFYVKDPVTGRMEQMFRKFSPTVLTDVLDMIVNGIDEKNNENSDMSDNSFSYLHRPVLAFSIREIKGEVDRMKRTGAFFPYTLSQSFQRLHDKLTWIGFCERGAEWMNLPCFVWSMIYLIRYHGWGEEFENEFMRNVRGINPGNYREFARKEIVKLCEMQQIKISITTLKEDFTYANTSLGDASWEKRVGIVIHQGHIFPMIETDICMRDLDKYLNPRDLDKPINNKKLTSRQVYEWLWKKGAFVPITYGSIMAMGLTDRAKLEAEMFPYVDPNRKELREVSGYQPRTCTDKVIFFADFECFINKDPNMIENTRSLLWANGKASRIKRISKFDGGYEEEEHIPYMVCYYAHVLGMPLEMSEVEPYVKCQRDKFYLFPEKLIEHYMILRDDIIYTTDEEGHKKLNTHITCYFHNLGYDGIFLMNNELRRVQITSIVRKGRKIFSITMRVPYKYEGKNHVFVIEFKDSLAMLQMSLKNAAKAYGIDQKELFSYEYPTAFRVTNEICEWDEFKEFTKEHDGWGEEEWNHVHKILEETKMIGTGPNGKEMFNLLGYTYYYCRRDVAVTCIAFMRFCQDINTHFGINPLCYLTLPSVAYAMLERQLADKDIYEYCGDLKATLSKCIYGGRCMSGYNMSHNIKQDIVDFDAVSLYPSAIARMYLPTGMPHDKGEWDNTHLMEDLFDPKEKYSPRKIPNILRWCPEEYCENDRTKISYFIAEIKIVKSRPLPFSNVVWKASCNDEVEENVNKPVRNGESVTMFVGAEYLRTLIRVDQIEFYMLNVYYWDGPREYCHQDLIRSMFDLRASLKKEKNCAQIAVKTLMNSMYGKTIQKDILQAETVVPNEEWDEYLRNNLNTLLGAESVGPRKYVKKIKTFSRDYRMIIFGVACLDMSKKIMNEVMGTAMDNGIKIFYQDTDSIHILKKDIGRLAELFKRRYGRELIGTNLGQFHSDFDLAGASGEVWSTHFICVGKKFYLDCLTDGHVKGYHIRGKGIASECLERKAAQMYDGEEPLVEFYEALVDGKAYYDVDSCDGAVRLNVGLQGISSMKNAIKRIRNTSQAPGVIEM